MKKTTKQKLLLTGFLGFTFLFGCNQIDDGEANASTQGEFEVVNGNEKISGASLTLFKHIDTGCYYILNQDGYAGDVTQMFIEKDGVTVPYCD